MDTTHVSTILVVNDNRPFVDMVEGWLSSEYNVLTAYTGEQALAIADDSVDVILLDRRMPGLSGDETLERLRERSTETVVAFLTSVVPTTDVVDLPVEGYIQKPVSPAAFREKVAELVRQRSYHRRVRRLYSTTQKRAVLEATLEPEALEADENYRSLRAEEARLTDQLDDVTREFSHEEFVRTFEIVSGEEL